MTRKILRLLIIYAAIIPWPAFAWGRRDTGFRERSLTITYLKLREGKFPRSLAMNPGHRHMKIDDATVHGFRSPFRIWAAESTAYTHEVCEMALAHSIKNKAEAAYQRSDLFEKRRRLMADWAIYCGGGRSGGATVTPIRGTAA